MSDEISTDIHWHKETEDALLDELAKKQEEKKEERHPFWCNCPKHKNSRIGIVIK